MILEFEVQNQTLSRKENNKTVENSRNYLQCAFTFSEDWDGLTKAVLFKSIDMEKPVAVLLIDENICNIPNGATTQHLSIAVVGGSSTFISSLASESAIDNDGTVITTNTLSIPFDDTLDTDCMADLNEPQNDFTKFLQQINSFKGSLETRMSGIEQTLSEKVDKVTGKELSANDFTDTLKSKLDGIESGAQKNTVVSVAGKTGTVTLSKSDVGLGNADNTSDSDKPVSTAQQAALDLKADQTSVDNVSADIDTINKALAGVYKKGGDVDRMTLNLPITDKSLINTVYNVVKKDWNGDYSELGGYFQFKYLCTMKNVKITKNGNSCYIKCSVSDIPSELYHRSFGNFTLNSGLGSICVQAGGTYQLFEYKSYSGHAPSEVLTFAYSGHQWGPDLTDDYLASNFTNNVWEIGNTTVAWEVNNISTDDNFAIIENGFDVLSCKITDYITKYQFDNLSATVAKKANQSDVDTALAAKAEQSDVDVINAALSGMYKNKGDVSEMTLDIPVSSSEINNVYNVKKGFLGGAAYGKGGAFRCRVEIKNAYIKKDDDGIYLCFTRNGLPSEMYYFNQSAHTFFGSYNDEVEFYPEENPQYKWRFAYFCTLPLSGTAEISARYTGSYGPGIDSYMSDKTFTDGKYQLGDIKTIWYRNDINPDDDFSITEHGYNLLTYKVTDYVNANTVNNMIVRHTAPLSYALASKANVADVYTKTEIDGAGYVKDTDYASQTKGGAVKVHPGYGIKIGEQGTLMTNRADGEMIDGRTNEYNPIVPANLNTAVKAALSDDKRISDMTDAEKANARDVIGAADKSDVYTKAETDSAIDERIGDIDTALDGIIALQNSLIGGGTA